MPISGSKSLFFGQFSGLQAQLTRKPDTAGLKSRLDQMGFEKRDQKITVGLFWF